MTALLLDSHVLHWWSAELARLGKRAAGAIEDAAELAVAAITWCELAWLASHQRIAVAIPVRSWLQGLAADVRTLDAGPAIADTATALPSTFPGDPADRLIFATAIETGSQLVTKDRRLRNHRHARQITLW